MGLPLSGLVNSAAGLASSILADSVICQFTDDGGTPLLEFDAVFSESFERPSAPTAYAVEDGTHISDHVQQLPQVLHLTAMVTDTPLTDFGDLAQIQSGNFSTGNPLIKEGLTTAASALLPALGVVVGSVAASLFTAGGTSPSVAAYNQLRKMQLGSGPGIPPQPFTVKSKLGTFANMMLTNLTVPRELEVGGALVFQLELVQIVVVSPQTVPVSAQDSPLAAATQAAVGQQSAAPSSPPSPPPESGRADPNEFVKGMVSGVKTVRKVKP